MRTSSALAVAFALAACGSVPVEDTAPAVAAELVDCALAGGAFERVCSIEHTRIGNATILTIRHPDGGFHRLELTGEGIAAADGAMPAEVTAASADVTEIAIDGARYRVPATIRHPAP